MSFHVLYRGIYNPITVMKPLSIFKQRVITLSLLNISGFSFSMFYWLLNATPAEAPFSLPRQYKTSNKLLILWIILIYCLFPIQLLYLLEHPSVLFLAQFYGWILSVLCERLPTSQQAAILPLASLSRSLVPTVLTPVRWVSTEEVIYSVFINI
jgi:hypothetical protein